MLSLSLSVCLSVSHDDNNNYHSNNSDGGGFGFDHHELSSREETPIGAFTSRPTA